MRQFERGLRREIRRCKYEAELVQGLVRYSKALDSENLHTAFLDLWSCLEYLTHTQTVFDKTIKRTVFLWRERDFAVEELNHLGRVRNQLVHAAKLPEEAEVLVFQLKRYVEELLSFHLASAPFFQTFAEAAEVLDFPADISILRRRARLYDWAKRFKR